MTIIRGRRWKKSNWSRLEAGGRLTNDRSFKLLNDNGFFFFHFFVSVNGDDTEPSVRKLAVEETAVLVRGDTSIHEAKQRRNRRD